jgi:hypothetical protein
MILMAPCITWASGGEGALDTPGPKWHLLRSEPFKGPVVPRAPSPPLAKVMHSPL